MFSFCKKKKEKKNYFEWCWQPHRIPYELNNNLEVSEDLFSSMIEPGSPTTCPWHKALKGERIEFQEKVVEGTRGSGSVTKQIQETHLEKLKESYEEYPDVSDQLGAVVMDASEGERNLYNTSVSTAKKCPAIISILKNIYVIKFPTDFILSIDENGRCVGTAPRTDLLRFASHHKNQFVPESDETHIFDNKVNVKFEFPIYMSTTNSTPWTFLQPIYHTEQPYTVAIGEVEGVYTKSQELNVNTFFNKAKKGEVDTYTFKAGDALAYIYFGEKLETKFINYDTKRFRHWFTGFTSKTSRQK